MSGANGQLAVDGVSTPTISPPLASPVTPTPATFHPPAQVTIPDPQDASLVTPTEKLSDPSSLSSSRPAPPSPAVSRRASSTLSRTSSRARSRPQSRVTSLSQQLQADHRAEGSSSTVVPAKRPLVKIRDFAYPKADDRHVGRGPDAPRINRPRNRGSVYSSSSSSACSDDEGDADEEHQRHNSFSSFRWNTLSTHFWNGKEGEEGADADASAGPSQTDFAMNFDQSSPVDEQDEDADDDDFYVQPSDDQPLTPGTYRALYPFEPEGTAEMALEEEQLVHVIGRGGGVGWAIVEREGGGHALVPESYLELVTPGER